MKALLSVLLAASCGTVLYLITTSRLEALATKRASLHEKGADAVERMMLQETLSSMHWQEDEEGDGSDEGDEGDEDKEDDDDVDGQRSQLVGWAGNGDLSELTDLK